MSSGSQNFPLTLRSPAASPTTSGKKVRRAAASGAAVESHAAVALEPQRACNSAGAERSVLFNELPLNKQQAFLQACGSAMTTPRSAKRLHQSQSRLRQQGRRVGTSDQDLDELPHQLDYSTTEAYCELRRLDQAIDAISDGAVNQTLARFGGDKVRSDAQFQSHQTLHNLAHGFEVSEIVTPRAPVAHSCQPVDPHIELSGAHSVAIAEIAELRRANQVYAQRVFSLEQENLSLKQQLDTVARAHKFPTTISALHNKNHF